MCEMKEEGKDSFFFFLQHIFIAYDEESMYTYVHCRDTITGEISFFPPMSNLQTFATTIGDSKNQHKTT